MVSNCAECKGTGLVPASPTHRWMVMDCPSCAGPSETVAEQAARLRERARLLEANIGHTFRDTGRAMDTLGEFSRRFHEREAARR